MLFDYTIKKYLNLLIFINFIFALTSSFTSHASLLSESETPAAAAKSSIAESVKDAFYIFNVGQGNSQLAIYAEVPDESFGILYDCGSSAQTVNSKFLQMRSKCPVEELSTFFTKKPTIIADFTQDIGPGEVKLSSSKKEKKRDSTDSLDSVMSYDAPKVRPKTSISDQIKQELQKVKNLFVVLSHPDKDHINLIVDSLPKEPNVLFILSGNFFIENEEANLRTDVGKLFEFIRKRRFENTKVETWVTLPYFWSSGNPSEYHHLTHQELTKYIFARPKGSATSAIKDPPKDNLLVASQVYSPKFFQGNFKAFLEQASSEEKEGIPFYKKFLMNNDLSHIHVWGGNQISSDVNNHSLVMSLRMPALEKTFICTGDAGHEVFLKIKRHLHEEKSAEMSISKRIDHFLHGSTPYTIILMLPHHGSRENRSLTMLELFRPHILGISAGSGSLYDHPAEELMQFYQEQYETLAPLKEKKNQVWEKYQLLGGYYRYITFKTVEPKEVSALEKKTKVTQAHLKSIKERQEIPILSTNCVGTIRITKDDFAGEHSMLFEKDGRFYEIETQTSIFTYKAGDLKTSSVTVDLKSIKSDVIEVPIGPNTQEIKLLKKPLKETSATSSNVGLNIFKRDEQDHNLFIREDKKEILLAIDIPVKEGKTKAVMHRKFYLGILVD